MLAEPIFHWDVQQHIFNPDNRWEFQTDPDWLNMRADKITASYASKLLVSGRDKTGLGADILNKLECRAMELFTGWVDDRSMSYQDKESLVRGIVFEQEARDWYEKKTGRTVKECGFVERNGFLGCSPDGVIPEEKRLVQIKVPMPHNFMRQVISKGNDYVDQCKMELLVCDYEVNDLLIYSPELKLGYIRSIERDPIADEKILEKAVVAWNYQTKVREEIKQLIKDNQ